MKSYSLILITALMAIIVAGCGVFESASAQIDCEGAHITGTNWNLDYDNTGSNRHVVTLIISDNQGFGLFDGTIAEAPTFTELDVNRSVEYRVEPHQNPITVRIVTKSGGSVANNIVHFEFTGDCDNIPFFGFGDDRVLADTGTALNAFVRDEGLSVYSEFYGGLFIPFTDLNITPSDNTLVASGNGIEVYVLSDGLIQIMEAPQSDGKRSILIIDLDDSNNVSRSRRGHYNIITGRTHIYMQTGGWEFYPLDF